MNFTRGMDPLRSMRIGIITWDKLNIGNKLRSKRWVPLTSLIDGGKFRFTSDGAKQNSHILALEELTIVEIERKKLSILKIKFQWNSRANITTIEGSIERFRKYFDIVQER